MLVRVLVGHFVACCCCVIDAVIDVAAVTVVHCRCHFLAISLLIVSGPAVVVYYNSVKFP